MQTIIQNDRVLCELEGGIPTAQLAAAIKFGLEAAAGVEAVHFVGEQVEVVCDDQGVSLDGILEALAHVGCPRASVTVRPARN